MHTLKAKRNFSTVKFKFKKNSPNTTIVYAQNDTQS